MLEPDLQAGWRLGWGWVWGLESPKGWGLMMSQVSEKQTGFGLGSQKQLQRESGREGVLGSVSTEGEGQIKA